MTAEHETLQVGDVAVAYRRAGNGEPLLYLHGSGLTRRWLPIHEEFSRRFDTLAPEHPGYGDTARPRWYADVDDIAVHYADVLTAWGIERAHVVGHSFGAGVAGAFAALYPERVLSLTIIAPGPLHIGADDPDIFAAFGPDTDFDAVLFNDRQAEYPEYENGDDDGLVVAASAADPRAESIEWSTMPSATLYRRLGRYVGPAQVLVPDEDRLFPPAFAEDWARALRDAPIISVPGDGYPTGHLLIAQEPARIAALVPPAN